ncbi:cytochrome P450 [Streptomyces sp. NEAU-174]|uniref:cytochrome P450 n=1 Tax=Streptomyces sp. NEAU-174 TaxID=3458254 RepID=UPI00404417D2
MSLLPTILVILLRGLQEPGHAYGAALLGLASMPGQLSRVIQDPTLIGRAVSEGMRWMSPLYAGASRTAAYDVVIGGQQVRAGDRLWLAYGSTNSDEAEFENPLAFDLDRPKHPNLAFGTGRHSCVGSAYAPAVARMVLEELFRAAPEIALDAA